MNYEKIIVELLGRIQTLEEQVEILMNQRNEEMKNESKETKKLGVHQLYKRCQKYSLILCVCISKGRIKHYTGLPRQR